MKKYILLLSLFISALNSYSQIEKGNIIISLEGNYSNTSSENGVTTNLTETDGKYLEIGSSIGLFLSDRFVAGFGFDYNWAKESRINKLYFNSFAQAENMKLTSKFPSPNLFIGYYYAIINKLYFNTTLKAGYGKVKTNYSTIYIGKEEIGSNQYAISSYADYKYDYFISKIQPAVTYFISNRVGLSISLGGIEYSMIDWKSDASDLRVNFNPAYWSFGLKYKI